MKNTTKTTKLLQVMVRWQYGAIAVLVGFILQLTMVMGQNRSEFDTGDGPSFILLSVGVLLAVIGIAVLVLKLRRLWKLAALALLVANTLFLALNWPAIQQVALGVYNLPPLNQPVTFEGKVSNINLECMSDGICSSYIAGRLVITGCGFVFDDSQCPRDEYVYQDLNEGDMVRVTATRTPDGTYLIHCDSCGISKL